MRFFRQTLLLVCLVLPCALLAQPVAADDAFSTPEDTDGLFNVVSNDSDPSFLIDPATVDLDISSPSTIENSISTVEGDFSVDPLGEVTFSPSPDFNGIATIQYTVKNNDVTPATSAPATITVTVTADNDPPVINSSIIDQNIMEDGTTGALTFSVADVETAVGSLSVTGASSLPSLIDVGEINIVGTGTNRTVTVTPKPDQFGTATITLRVTDDGMLFDEAEFDVVVAPVNDAPQITTILDQSIAEDGATAGLTFTISDIDSPLGSLTSSSSVPTLVDAGGIVITGTAPTYTVTVTPLANQSGTTTITLRVTDDGMLFDEEQFDVVVAAVNDAPQIVSTIADQSIAEDGATAGLSFTISDIDTPLGSLNFSSLSSVPTLVDAGGVVVTGAGPTRTVTVTPLADQSGTTTIALRVTDSGLLFDEEQFDVVVAAVNDAPQITTIVDQSIPENGATAPLSFTISDIDSPLGALNVTGLSSVPTLVNASGIVFSGMTPTRTVTITPLADQTGTTTITVRVTDDGMLNDETQFDVAVTASNDPPQITSILDQNIMEDGATAGLTFTISDPDSPIGSLNVTALSSQPSLVNAGGIALSGTGASRSVIITPLANQSGTTTITLRVTDDGLLFDEEQFDVVVAPVNDAPQITTIIDQSIAEDGATAGLSFTISDIDSPLGSVTSLSSVPALVDAGGIVITGAGATRTVTVTPLANQSGTTMITLRVTDSGLLFDEEQFNVLVNPVNDPPAITSILDQTIPEDGATAALSFTISDIDSPIGSLNVAALSSVTSLVNAGGISIAGVGATRTVTVSPLTNQSGTTNITLTVTDNGPLSASTDFDVLVNAVNDAPVISSIGGVSTEQDTPSAAVPFNVSDPDNAVGSLVVTGTSSNAALIPNGNIQLAPVSGGNWTVTLVPVNGQAGTANITIRVSDTQAFDETTFLFTVDAANQVPTITVIADQTVNEDNATGAIPFTIGDFETAPGTLGVSASSSNPTLVTVGNIVFGGSGASRNVTVTPTANLSGFSDITITVTDEESATAVEIYRVTVSPVNDAPQFVSVVADQTINEDGATGALTFNIADLETAAGSLTVTGTSLTPALVAPAGVVVAGGGATRNVTITPLPNQSGDATIRLTVSDGSLSAQIFFTVTINAENDFPTITSIPTQNISEGGSTGPLAFTIGDLETASISLTVLPPISSNTALVDNGDIIVGGTGSLRNVNVIPKINQSGSTTITLTVTDGLLSAATNFLVNVAAVDDPPTVSAIDDISINEDVPSAFLPFTVGDAETPPEDIGVTAESSNQAVITDGNILLTEGTGGNWTVRVTPVPQASGIATITLTISDGVENVTETFIVTVDPVNDNPTISAIANQNIDEDQATSPLAFTIADQETPLASLTLSALSSNTTLVPVSNIVFGGTAAAPTVVVTPVADEYGTATITIRVTDGNSSTAQEVFILTVDPVNDTPTMDAIADATINEDQAGGTGLINFGVTDIEPGALTVTKISSTNLGLVPLANIVLGGSGASRTVRVTPLANQFGASTITLRVTDGGAPALWAERSFTVNVTGVNDLPTITTVANQTIDEGTSTGSLAFNVGDIETPAASLVVTRLSSNQGLIPDGNVVLGGSGPARNVTVTPLPGQNGTSTITLTVDDLTTTVSTTFDVTVSSVNDPPTITSFTPQTINEDGTVGPLTFTIGDPDTAIGSLSVSGSSSTPALVPNGNIVFSGSGTTRTVTINPLLNQSGTTNITISVSDGDLSASELFLMTVNAQNDPPTITAIADQTTNEDVPTGNITFTVADPETAAASLDVTAVSSNTTLLPNGNITLGISGTQRTIQLTPVADLNGETNITVTVSDGSLQATRVFKLTVTPINDLPTITAIADQTIPEDTSTPALPFTIGDSETPIGSLILNKSSSNTTLVPIANIVIAGSGASRTVTVTPDNNRTGTATITLTVDDLTTTTIEEFDVTVTGVNDPPVISNITDRTVNEDTPTGNISFTISDPETPATGLNVSAVSDNTTLVPNANIVLAGTTGTRTVNISPAEDKFGEANITISVTDGTATTDRTFKVTVNPVNDLPVITAQIAMNIDESTPFTLLLNQFTIDDPDNLVSEMTLYVTGGANYSITGATTITPIPNYSGPLSVPVFVSDGTPGGFGPIFGVQITVNSTNNAPSITGQDALTMNEDQTLTLQVDDFTVNDPDNNFPADFTLEVLDGTNYNHTGNTIAPVLNYNGTLTVNVRVKDGSLNSPSFPAQVNVAAVNDPPAITAQSPSISVNEDSPLTLVIGNFTVVDPEPTTYTLTVSPPAPGADYTVVGNIITPKLNFNGLLQVPVTVSDGALNSASYSTQITVSPINDAPVITGQRSLATIEDIPLTLVFGDLTVDDVDNTYPTGFSIIVEDGTGYTHSGTTITPELDFTGPLSVNVKVSDGDLQSATRIITINVTDDADAPKINGQNDVTMNEDTSREIVLDDLDWEDPDTLLEEMSVQVQNGTGYTASGTTITTPANYFGTITVNVRIYDGEAYSNVHPLQVTVSPVNDLPSFNVISDVTVLEDAATQSININGISAGPLESQQMDLTIVSNNTSLIPHPVKTPAYNGTAASQIITFKPQANEYGTAIITVELTDIGLGKATRTFTITVTGVNDAPTLDAITFAPIIEDAPEQIINLTGISPGGGTPEQNQFPNLKLIVGIDPQIADVTQEYTPGQTTGTLRIKPKANASGTAQVTLRLEDGGDNAPVPNVNFITRVFDLVIDPVNDHPVIVSTPGQIAEPGIPYSYQIEVTDADNDPLTITAPNIPPWLTLTQVSNGIATLTGTPPPLATGDVTIELYVQDVASELVTGSYTISVNSRPVVAKITINIDEDTQRPLTVADFTPGFNDTDGNPLAELEVTKLPLHGRVTTTNNTLVQLHDKFAVAAIPSLTYIPDENFTGVDSLRWNGADGFLLYAIKDAQIQINVKSVNDPPIIVTMELESDTLKYELGSEEPQPLTKIFDGVDPDGDDLTGVTIAFKRIDNFQYRPENDLLTFTATSKITGNFEPTSGILKLSGAATSTEYDSVIRSVRYSYVQARDLLLDTRSVSITLSDGQGGESLPRSRIIKLIYTFEDLSIPAAFSPNEGDNVNQTWAISSPNAPIYKDAEIKVYNKRGLLLWQAKGIENNEWNGVYDGSVLPTDTYFYTIDLKYNRVQYKGTVTLLR